MKAQILKPQVVELEDVESRELLPGYNGRFIHSTNMTHVYWEILKGHELPEHSHKHEQIVNMLEGTFELRVEGTPHRLRPGQVFVIPPNVPHSGVGITDCRILDVFSPPREDYF